MKKKASPSPQDLKPGELQPRRRKHPAHSAGTEVPAGVDEAALLTDLRDLIQSARQRIATVANATTSLLYWHLGRRLLTENLQDGRAAYGQRILATVSRELTAAPIGLILCASADAEQVELLELDAKSIRVSEYLTELPPVPLLRARLHQAIEHARSIDPTATAAYVNAYREYWDSDEPGGQA